MVNLGLGGYPSLPTWNQRSKSSIHILEAFSSFIEFGQIHSEGTIEEIAFPRSEIKFGHRKKASSPYSFNPDCRRLLLQIQQKVVIGAPLFTCHVLSGRVETHFDAWRHLHILGFRK